MSCELTQSVLHGYVDGELDAARAADFERHLASCPECVAALETQEALRVSLQRVGLYERAPAALRQKVRTELSPSAAAPVGSVSRFSSWRWLAAAAVLLVTLGIGWQLVPQLLENSADMAYASEIVDAHLRSLQPGHLADVISTDQHTVKPWFDGKLDFAPPVVELVNEGFPLQGGRLDVIHGRSVAVLVYARRKHLINVFIWPTAGRDAKPQSGSRLGYHWVNWRKGSMEMCAVSDVNPADLDALQRLLAE